MVLGITCVATVAAWSMPQALLTVGERWRGDKPAVAHLGNADRLGAAYRQWVAAHDASGGDHNVALALRWSKGLSVDFSRATGEARLDLIRGSVAVEVRGLDEATEWTVWLVDNVPGPGRSVVPESGDKILLAGTLRGESGVARLQTQLDPRALADFEVDLVVVARPGDDLAERGVLFGAPALFQRLYTRARLGRPAIPGEAEPLAGWIRPRAHATVPVASLDRLVVRGAELFFNETFRGNGRTCGTCHPAENNFTIDPKFIATLPPNDPLFVAEFTPALAEHFEKPELMRKVGLILENVDGFDDLPSKFVMRGVPHIFAMNTSLRPATNDGTTQPPNERTGWSGDGAPGSGTLREFAIGAVTQHFTRTLRRRPGIDFRLPTDEELDALEAFQRFVGRDRDPDLATLRLKDAVARRGLEIFRTNDTQRGTVAAGKCGLCHANAGATTSVTPGGTNDNFATGVEQLVDAPGDLVDPANTPPDGGFGTQPGASGFGNGTFNTPPLVEAPDTSPFFHNNAVNTIEEAVGFFNSAAFNSSPSGQFLARNDTGGIGIQLEATQVQAVAAFLRVLNALENIRAAGEIQTFVLDVRGHDVARSLLKLAIKDQHDAIQVLEGAALHPDAVRYLQKASEQLRHAQLSPIRGVRNQLIRQSLAEQRAAKADLIED
jgi:hypothetical protein